MSEILKENRTFLIQIGHISRACIKNQNSCNQILVYIYSSGLLPEYLAVDLQGGAEVTLDVVAGGIARC